MEVSEVAFFKAVTLLLLLLNPFLMSIYLLDLIRTLDGTTFVRVIVRGMIIATGVFWAFAIGGDAIFADILQVRFASFLVFGGILFLLIAIAFVQKGPSALTQLRGKPEHVAGSVAIPFMVGPGTISASIFAGARLPVAWALVAISVAMVLTVAGLAGLKWLHSQVKRRNEALVDRYIDLTGRVSALLIGTIAVDMILSGLELWQSTPHALP
jgi:multiple antibiotic resistance protein